MDGIVRLFQIVLIVMKNQSAADSRFSIAHLLEREGIALKVAAQKNLVHVRVLEIIPQRMDQLFSDRSVLQTFPQSAFITENNLRKRVSPYRQDAPHFRPVFIGAAF